VDDTSPVRLFFVFLKSPASHHSSHQLRSAVDCSAAKMPALRPAIAFAEEVTFRRDAPCAHWCHITQCVGAVACCRCLWVSSTAWRSQKRWRVRIFARRARLTLWTTRGDLASSMVRASHGCTCVAVQPTWQPMCAHPCRCTGAAWAAITIRAQVDRVERERFDMGLSEAEVSVRRLKEIDPDGAYELVAASQLTGYILGMMVRLV